MGEVIVIIVVQVYTIIAKILIGDYLKPLRSGVFVGVVSSMLFNHTTYHHISHYLKYHFVKNTIAFTLHLVYNLTRLFYIYLHTIYYKFKLIINK